MNIQSLLVGQFLFIVVKLVFRYNCRKSDSRIRRTSAIQLTINLSKIMFRWSRLFDITGNRCNDGFMLVFTERCIISDPFSPKRPCRSAENKAELVIKQGKNVCLFFTQRSDRDV